MTDYLNNRPCAKLSSLQCSIYILLALTELLMIELRGTARPPLTNRQPCRSHLDPVARSEGPVLGHSQPLVLRLALTLTDSLLLFAKVWTSLNQGWLNLYTQKKAINVGKMWCPEISGTGRLSLWSTGGRLHDLITSQAASGKDSGGTDRLLCRWQVPLRLQMRTLVWIE